MITLNGMTVLVLKVYLETVLSERVGSLEGAIGVYLTSLQYSNSWNLGVTRMVPFRPYGIKEDPKWNPNLTTPRRLLRGILIVLGLRTSMYNTCLGEALGLKTLISGTSTAQALGSANITA